MDLNCKAYATPQTTSWERPLKEARKGDWGMEMGPRCSSTHSHPCIFSSNTQRWRWRSLPDIFNQIYQILLGEVTRASLLSVSFHSIGDTDTVTARADGHRARKCFKLLPAAACVRACACQPLSVCTNHLTPLLWLHCDSNTGGALHKLLKFSSH